MIDGALTIRRATDDDRPQILALMTSALGWEDDTRHVQLFDWKHTANPFGPSPSWVATDGDRVLGFRTFLRWQFTYQRRSVKAVRAVDTATHPDARGLGIFRSLTTAAIEDLREEGVDWIFNTPNEQSKPGYLKMGWSEVGRLPLSLRPSAQPRSWVAVGRSRHGHASLWPEDEGDVSQLDAAAEAVSRFRVTAPNQVETAASASFYRWRYGLPSLGYRVVAHPDGLDRGCAFVRTRRRADALELTVAEVAAEGGDRRAVRTLIRIALERSGADVATALQRHPGMICVGSLGPALTVRAVTTEPPTEASSWSLTLGDVELL